MLDKIISDLLVVKDTATGVLKELNVHKVALDDELNKLNSNQDVDEVRLIATTKKFKEAYHKFNLISTDKKALEDKVCDLLKIDAREISTIVLVYKYDKFKSTVVSEKKE